MNNRLFAALTAGVALVLVPGCGDADGNSTAGDVSNAAQPAEPVAAGGVDMDPNRTIAQNVAEAGDLSSFRAAVEAAGLSETLEGVGPYTVFAPSDEAFGALPDGALDALVSAGGPELINLLSYHIVPGVVTSEDLAAALDRSEGEVVLATMTGAPLTIARDGEDIVIRDGAGASARIAQADAIQSNGVLHVVDLVLNPGEGEGAGTADSPAGNETAP